MYRQYENPRALEDELAKVKAEFDDLATMTKMDDDTLYYYHEKMAELKDRINFAYQDEEYD
ncbi:MAG: hypothetical protein IIU51_03090, partial [Bacteroidaceae bacterium]|nr:hypothetical protein [Bacteroidaceae bacterium]